MADQIVSASDYLFVTTLLRERCSLALEPGKDYLILSRLLPVARRHGLDSVGALLGKVRGDALSRLADEIVEAMVTTETSFFRDTHPFEALRQSVLPDLIERRRAVRRLNVWSAACSTGQEPYSVAMLLKEHFPELRDWRIHLFATDVSREMVRRSELGQYSQTEVNRGLSTALLERWFREAGSIWRLDDEIRGMVTFSHLNLARPWPAMPRWDLVLMRNVLIYFDVQAKKEVLLQVSRALADDGYLLLGSAETTLNLADSFVRVYSARSGVFRLKR